MIRLFMVWTWTVLVPIQSSGLEKDRPLEKWQASRDSSIEQQWVLALYRWPSINRVSWKGNGGSRALLDTASLGWKHHQEISACSRVSKMIGWRKTRASRADAINLKRQHALNTVIKEPDRLYFMIIFVTFFFCFSNSSLEQYVG